MSKFWSIIDSSLYLVINSFFVSSAEVLLLLSSYIIAVPENTLSDTTFLGGVLNYFLANSHSNMYALRSAAHHLKGLFPLNSSNGSARYFSTSHA